MEYNGDGVGNTRDCNNQTQQGGGNSHSQVMEYAEGAGLVAQGTVDGS